MTTAFANKYEMFGTVNRISCNCARVCVYGKTKEIYVPCIGVLYDPLKYNLFTESIKV